MALTYRCFKNRTTGQVIYAPAGRYGNFLNTIKKLVSYVRYNIPRYYVAHLTLTVAENASEIDYKHLHRVIQFIHLRLKRAESDFKYVAVKELQNRGAVHYHVLCIYSKPYVFPSSDEIAASWKLGIIKITAPKIRLKLQSITRYIGKYIGKGYEFETLDHRKSFTASQIKQIYKLSPLRLAEVITRFGKERAEGFACTYRKVFLLGYEALEILGKEVLNPIKYLILEFASEWKYQGVYDEAF
jgi:hypothetical protein